MNENVLVIPHYFIGVFAFLCFCIALVLPKKSRYHAKVGKIYFTVYSLVLITAILLSIFFDVFQNINLKMMLLTETFFVIGILHRGYTAVKIKIFSEKIKRRNLFFTIISTIIGTALFLHGLFIENNVLVGLGSFIAFFSALDIVEVWFQNQHHYNWTYNHLYGMIFSGILLPLNGTGFFGIHDIFMANNGYVPIERMYYSLIPLIVIALIVKCFGLYMRSTQKIQTSL